MQMGRTYSSCGTSKRRAQAWKSRRAAHHQERRNAGVERVRNPTGALSLPVWAGKRLPVKRSYWQSGKTLDTRTDGAFVSACTRQAQGVNMIFIQRILKREYNPETERWDKVTYAPCPFGVRDLQNDECYSGNGVNRCKYFVRYDWEKHEGCIACSHPEKENQLTLFDL